MRRQLSDLAEGKVLALIMISQIIGVALILAASASRPPNPPATTLIAAFAAAVSLTEEGGRSTNSTTEGRGEEGEGQRRGKSVWSP